MQLCLQCLQLLLAALLFTAESVTKLLQLSLQGCYLLTMPLCCPAQAVSLLLQVCYPGALLCSHLAGHKTPIKTVLRTWH